MNLVAQERATGELSDDHPGQAAEESNAINFHANRWAIRGELIFPFSLCLNFAARLSSKFHLSQVVDRA